MKTAVLALAVLALIGCAHAESAKLTFSNGMNSPVTQISINDGTTTHVYAGPLGAGKMSPASNGISPGSFSWTAAQSSLPFVVIVRTSDNKLLSFKKTCTMTAADNGSTVVFELKSNGGLVMNRPKSGACTFA